jgi:hypothetical protein
VTNLNADLLDGQHATAFATAAQGATADTALQNVVEDTTPQLGGALDVNGNDITSSTGFTVEHTDDSLSGIFFWKSTGAAMTRSSGNQRFLNINPAVNQSGSANYTIVDINVTETAVGSGEKTLFNARVGGTSQWKVNNEGTVTQLGDIVWAEKADHSSTPEAGFGYLWVKNTAPTTLVFTDDAGTDVDLGAFGGGDLLADGTVPLTANWDVGAFTITGTQFISDIATGTAPFVVSSTTLVSNLNADLLDGNEATDFATAAQGATADTALQNVVEDTTPQLGGPLDGQGEDLNSMGVMFLTEQAAAEADVAGQGQLWVKNDAPNTLWFTDDAGTDVQLGLSGVDWKAGTESGFHSLGIDDNATGERLQLSDSQLMLGTTGPDTSVNWTITHADTDQVLQIYGGNAIESGSGIHFYGPDNASFALDIVLKAGPDIEGWYKDADSEWDFQANAIITTGTVTSGPVFIAEQAAADADVAGQGQLWIKNDTPNTLWFTDDAGTDVQIGGAVTESFIIPLSDETSDLTTGAAKRTFRMPYAFTLTEVRCDVVTAPTGSVLTVDINEGGVSILSTKLTIDAGEDTSETAATPAVISDSSLADNAKISFDIDTVGSTVAGAGLKVDLIGYQT